VSTEQPEGWQREPADPDLADVVESRVILLVVLALGGAIGAGARYAAGLAWPTPSGAFPWTTVVINVVGCALMGALMVLTHERFATPPWLRPFLGTGVLGGFTTFSTYAVDVDRLGRSDSVPTAAATFVLTLVLAVFAVWAGATATRSLTRRRP